MPVVITWTGKLVVEPLAVGQENPIKDGEAVVRSKVRRWSATQQGSTIYSGTLTYRTEDQAMLLTPMGPDKPVVIRTRRGRSCTRRGWISTSRSGRRSCMA